VRYAVLAGIAHPTVSAPRSGWRHPADGGRQASLWVWLAGYSQRQLREIDAAAKAARKQRRDKRCQVGQLRGETLGALATFGGRRRSVKVNRRVTVRFEGDEGGQLRTAILGALAALDGT